MRGPAHLSTFVHPGVEQIVHERPPERVTLVRPSDLLNVDRRRVGASQQQLRPIGCLVHGQAKTVARVCPVSLHQLRAGVLRSEKRGSHAVLTTHRDILCARQRLHPARNGTAASQLPAVKHTSAQPAFQYGALLRRASSSARFPRQFARQNNRRIRDDLAGWLLFGPGRNHRSPGRLDENPRPIPRRQLRSRC
jgi:hypothetical protein